LKTPEDDRTADIAEAFTRTAVKDNDEVLASEAGGTSGDQTTAISVDQTPPFASGTPALSRANATKSSPFQRIPGVIVAIMLLGLFFWGHQNHWRIPKFSALLGQQAPGNDDWCAEHLVPESICVVCHPEVYWSLVAGSPPSGGSPVEHAEHGNGGGGADGCSDGCQGQAPTPVAESGCKDQCCPGDGSRAHPPEMRTVRADGPVCPANHCGSASADELHDHEHGFFSPIWGKIEFCTRHLVAACAFCVPAYRQLENSGTGDQIVRAYLEADSSEVSAAKESTAATPGLLAGKVVQLASAEVGQKIGIRFSPVEVGPMTRDITVPAEITLPPTATVRIQARVSGTVALLPKDLGAEVDVGEIIAILDSAELSDLKTRLVDALVQRRAMREQLERLESAQGVVPAKSIIEARVALERSELAVQSARQALENLGLSVLPEVADQGAAELWQQIRLLGIPAELEARHRGLNPSANWLAIRSPIRGTITRFAVGPGQSVEVGQELLQVVDLKELWIQLAVPEEHLSELRPNLEVEFLPSAAASIQGPIRGQIFWISPAVDAQSRTVLAMAKISPQSWGLQVGLYGRGRIILQQKSQTLLVPRQAIQTFGQADHVFVRDRYYGQSNALAIFHIRQVRLGATSETHAEVLAGVLPGEVVVTEGSRVLLMHALRSKLGAACGEDH